MRLPVDETNHLRKAFDPTEMLLIFVPLMAAAFEASRWSATPGKRLFNLLVRTKENARPGLGQTLLRNVLKYLFAFAGLLQIPALFEFMAATPEQIQALIIDDNLTLRPAVDVMWDISPLPAMLESTATGFIGLASLIITFSILFPTKNAGRALYDKWAGTMVVRQAAETVLPTPSAPA